jgi:hypothetical protein
LPRCAAVARSGFRPDPRARPGTAWLTVRRRDRAQGQGSTACACVQQPPPAPTPL